MLNRAVIASLAVPCLFTSSSALEMPGLGKAATAPTSIWQKTYTFPIYKEAKATVRLIDYKIEALLLVLAIVYLLLHLIGKARNRSVALAWLTRAQPLLEDEFALVLYEDDQEGKQPHQGEGIAKLIWNGGSEALAYASGRRGVDGLQILFTLEPYHDIFELLYRTVKGFALPAASGFPGETISLTFLLPYLQPDNVGGVFAVVDKTQLRASRQGRFDMTFTKVLEAENANEQRSLDAGFAIMSETSELTDALLGEIGERGQAQRHRVGLQAALNSAAGKYLLSLVLTDQPEKRPEEGAIPVAARKRKLVVTMRMPRNATEARESLPLVEAACNIVDALDMSHAKLTTTTVAKLRNIRAQVDKDMDEEANKWKKEEEDEAKAEAKRKAEKEKFEKLSPAEQEKRRQIEKKRAQKKAQGKSVKMR